MKVKFKTVMREFSGKPAVRFFALLAASCLLGAGSLPEVDLLDSAGAKVGHVALTVAGDKCHVRLTIGKMPPGRYRPVLAKGQKCFGSGEDSTQAVAEAAYFVVEADGASTAEFVFSSVNESGSLEEVIARSGLMFQALPEHTSEKSKVAAVCGQVSRWFSPWRDVRQSAGR